jgi:hypothetical protein
MGGKCIKDSKPVSIVATSKQSTMQVIEDKNQNNQVPENKSAISGSTDQV